MVIDPLARGPFGREARSMRKQEKPPPEPRFQIVLVPRAGPFLIVLAAAATADEATLAFEAERQRLQRERRSGVLLVRRRNGAWTTVLREPVDRRRRAGGPGRPLGMTGRER
jgi:hypothetical protein